MCVCVSSTTTIFLPMASTTTPAADAATYYDTETGEPVIIPDSTPGTDDDEPAAT